MKKFPIYRAIAFSALIGAAFEAARPAGRDREIQFPWASSASCTLRTVTALLVIGFTPRASI
jgi:hypothetical protein